MVRATQNKKQSKATGTQTTVLRRKTTKQIKNDVVSCLVKYIQNIVQPDYTELREEIGKHEFVSMRLGLGTYDEDTGEETSPEAKT